MHPLILLFDTWACIVNLCVLCIAYVHSGFTDYSSVLPFTLYYCIPVYNSHQSVFYAILGYRSSVLFAISNVVNDQFLSRLRRM